ncbi:MAG: hypothetical protein GWN01_11700 [Nitrosopumilaceae archaeon]|nr:hypothetical protein [Nitrosopumilaceae archaeon]NIU01540.1 hypothetical protein [Nitrosopumilaceae archaeon]NIU87959.1 hypothetical protein [Nitrosopumilaceae archaeon]NIV66231.1 hypothetical protein [Nitrosopumilaceae archaeon]NIX62142.1 hypothetical protein [Nitrosopumilaceae archaeon]
MGYLEMLVIATIIITGAYVGYHYWQDSMTVPDDHNSEGETHEISSITYGVLYQNIITPIQR